MSTDQQVGGGAESDLHRPGQPNWLLPHSGQHRRSFEILNSWVGMSPSTAQSLPDHNSVIPIFVPPVPGIHMCDACGQRRRNVIIAS